MNFAEIVKMDDPLTGRTKGRLDISEKNVL